MILYWFLYINSDIPYKVTLKKHVMQQEDAAEERKVALANMTQTLTGWRCQVLR